MSPVLFAAPPNMKLEDAVTKMLLTAEGAFLDSPATRELAQPSFKLEDIEIKQEYHF
ncbi:hypothetical protein M422DRAFT_243035 [Sphaerobolus stellatus SS14]|nr:hypothetical protein M422DRAFT_243035 [Sphaerobolus stellatus SS14]